MVARAGSLDRRQAVATLLAGRGDALVVSGLGSPTWDVYAAGDDDANYYLWGAMGSAALVGLGLAIAQPKRRVMVVTGDGEQLMGLGGLATIAISQPANLDIYVLDNGLYGETGGQDSATGRGIDLAAVAASCGFADTDVVDSDGDLAVLVTRHSTPARGPRLAVVSISADNPERSMPTRDAVFVKNRFRANLGLAPN